VELEHQLDDGLWLGDLRVCDVPCILARRRVHRDPSELVDAVEVQ
jgi:hypothetical protein